MMCTVYCKYFRFPLSYIFAGRDLMFNGGTLSNLLGSAQLSTYTIPSTRASTLRLWEKALF